MTEKVKMERQPPQKEKPKYRKGLWSPEEDNKLRNHILEYGHGCWSSVPIKAGLQRNGKSCRLRWINYLRPGLKRGVFSKHEEDTILTLHHMLGNKWSQISQHLPGRTDNEIKNYWHSYLKKKLIKAKEMKSDKESQYSSDTMGNSLSSQKLETQDPSYGLLGNMEKPVEHSENFFSQSYNFSNEACQSSLPKLLFSEWLSVDNLNASSVNSDDSLVLGNEFDQNSTFQEAIMHMLEENFCEEYHNTLIHSSTNEVYNSQLKSTNQEDGNDFIHCIPEADLCSNFSLTNGATYRVDTTGKDMASVADD
ncbi:hypothetical protein Fmac_015889 [Flemingia macrophylla]|uniref:Uncharacterized protein n=1 Tax=Flemingia macrophylla TaxID=520843 RepID=A0ABD1MFT9_9FABA